MHKTEDFYRKKGETKELLAKGKTRLYLVQDSFSLEDERENVFIIQIASSFYRGWRKLDQKIPDLLIKVMFLKEVETTIR